MAYLCPLCLKQLTADDELEARCVTHIGSEIGFLGTDTPPSRCREMGCETGLHLGYLDLLCRHIDCDWGRNPFWDGSAVSVETRVTPPGLAVQEQVSHWELEALGGLASLGVPEMWFPIRLLVPADRSARHSKGMTLVSLCGAKNVGKTYVAMHALDAQGLASTRDDFIYCYPKEARDVSTAAQEFLQTLRLREVMAANSAFVSHLASTEIRPRNLKVSFFVPSDPKTSWLAGWYRKLAAGFSDGVHALMLYDIAGEASISAFSKLVVEHDRCVDVVAVMISAEDVQGGQRGPTSPNTIPVAINRLKALGARKANQEIRCALIVTKSDLWTKATGVPLDEAELLKRLRSDRDPSVRELVAALDQQAVDRIFFVHPDDAQSDVPNIIGLTAFAEWCAAGR